MRPSRCSSTMPACQLSRCKWPGHSQTAEPGSGIAGGSPAARMTPQADVEYPQTPSIARVAPEAAHARPQLPTGHDSYFGRGVAQTVSRALRSLRCELLLASFQSL